MDKEYWPVEDIVNDVYRDITKDWDTISLRPDEEREIKRIVAEMTREICYQNDIYGDITKESKKEIYKGNRVRAEERG